MLSRNAIKKCKNSCARLQKLTFEHEQLKIAHPEIQKIKQRQNNYKNLVKIAYKLPVLKI